MKDRIIETIRRLLSALIRPYRAARIQAADIYLADLELERRQLLVASEAIAINLRQIEIRIAQAKRAQALLWPRSLPASQKS